MVVSGQGQLEDLILAGRPVEHADLSAIDWTDLPDGVLDARHCVLRDAGVFDAELTGARFTACTFERTRFSGANLTDAVFSGCSFFDTFSREGCDFGRADLYGATFENCNLSTARFGLAGLFGATFRSCKAGGADFEDARFSKQTGSRIPVSRVAFIDTMLDMASFRGARLDDCLFSQCSLRQADLRQVSLARADLRGSDLSEANLGGAVLDGGDLCDAKLSGIDLTALASFAGLKVSEDQLAALVRPLGIRVFPRGR